MARFTTTAAVAAALLSIAAAGQAAPYDRYGLTPDKNPSISSVNQPIVQRTDYVFDVSASGGVPSGELRRLDGWFQSLNLGYGDRVSIDSPGGYADGRVVEDIGRVAAAYGLLLSEGAPITAGAVAPGSVRVIISRNTAFVPGCPHWDPTTIGERITTAPNYGCATNSNLAAMIANPADLVAGEEGPTSIDAATSSKAIQIYRKAAPTGGGGSTVKQESTQQGGSSK